MTEKKSGSEGNGGALPGDVHAAESGGDAAAAAGPGEETAGAVTGATAVGETTAVTEIKDAGPAEPAASGRKSGRLHVVFIALLVLLSCLALVVTGLAWWSHYTVLNTNGYMKIVGPVGKDPAAIRALSGYVAGQVVTLSDLQARTQNALPAQAQFLAGPITDAVTSFINKETTKVLSTPQAYQAWLKVNQVAHQELVGLLRGDSKYAYIQGSDLKLNVLPLVSQVLVWIDGKLPGTLSSKFSPPVVAPGTPASESVQQFSQWAGKALPADFGQVTLASHTAISKAKTAVRIFDAVVIILPILTLVLVALSIWLSRRRRTTIIALGVGAAVALIITYVIIKQASKVITNSLHQGDVTTIVKDIVNNALGPFATLTIWIAVIGAAIAIIAWFLGRRDLRSAAANAGKAVVQKQSTALATESPTVGWVAAHLGLLRVVGLVIGLILLVTVASSWLGIAFILLLTLLYEGLLSLLVGHWPFAQGGEGDPSSG